MIYDPPSGWAYGFPKEWPKDLKRTTENIIRQLIKDGYPVENIRFNAKHTRFIGDWKDLKESRG
jgi:hypothetical protein